MAVTKRQNKAKKAENKNASEGLAKLGAKEYERELASCAASGQAAALGRRQRIESRGRLRGPRRRRQGRGHQGHHRARQSACVSRRRAPGADRAQSRQSPSRSPDTRIFATPGPALLPVSVLHAHKGIVDRGRLIKPMARIAVCGLAARRPAVRIEGELVMPHRHYVTLRAFWLDGRVRRRLRGRRNP